MILKDGSEWFPSEEDLGVWHRAYPHVDLQAEIRKMDAWLYSNPGKRKTRRGMPRFCNSWLSRIPKGVSRETSTRSRSLAEDLSDTSWAE